MSTDTVNGLATALLAAAAKGGATLLVREVVANLTDREVLALNAQVGMFHLDVPGERIVTALLAARMQHISPDVLADSLGESAR